MQVTPVIDAKEAVAKLRKFSTYFSDDHVGQILARTLNHSGEKGRTEVGRLVMGLYNVPKRVVNKSINFKKAYKKRLYVILTVKGPPVNLDKFQPQQLDTYKDRKTGELISRNQRKRIGKRGGLLVTKVKPGQKHKSGYATLSIKLYANHRGRQLIRGAFIGITKAKENTVMGRGEYQPGGGFIMSKERTPAMKLTGPSVPMMFSRKHLQATFYNRVSKEAAGRLMQEAKQMRREILSGLR